MKRTVSFILSLVVAISFVVGMKFSATASSENIQVGDYITLGSYYGEPIVWRCIGIDENGPLMLSDRILCLKAFDAKGDDPEYHTDGWGWVRKERGSNCWSDSSLRQWLNSSEATVNYSHCPPTQDNIYKGYNAYADEAGFLSGFSMQDLAAIKSVTQRAYINSQELSRDGYCDGGNKELDYFVNISEDYSSYYYQLVQDRIFLLGPEQVDMGVKNLGIDYILTAYPTQAAVNNSEYKDELLRADNYWDFWLGIPRNTGASYENQTLSSLLTGKTIVRDTLGCCTGTLGVRPAFYLNESYAPALTLEQYMSNVILGYNYNGSLRTLNGSTPQNYLYEYALQPNQISLTRTYVDLLHKNEEFMINVAGWKIATFSPTDIYENVLDEIGYYEAVIMNVLDCAVKYTVLPAAVEDVQQTISGMTSSVLEVLQTNAELNYEDLLRQPWEMFSESAQLQAIGTAGAKCTALSKISGYNATLSDVFSTASNIREACEKLASLEKIAEADVYVVNVLDALYTSCPADNTAMRTAISEIKTVCESSFNKAMVELLNGAVTATNIVVSTGIETLWSEAIAAAGSGLGAGALLGQVIGTALSNFLFSTDACLEQFYVLEALTELEDVLISVVQIFADTYKVLNTSDSAKNFLTAEKMLLGLYDLSADYAKDFTEIIQTKGAINGIKSIFGFGNEQKFEEYCQVAESMKNSIEIFKRALFDFDYGYKKALRIDNPTAYAAYCSSDFESNEYWNVSVITVACPTDVDIYDENGQKVAVVLNNQLIGLVPGVAIWIDGDVKHLVLPKDGNYQIQITGTDAGTMDYAVSEFVSGTYAREIAHTDVPLTAGCTYAAAVPSTDGIETDTYVLTDENGEALSPTVDSQDLKISGASLTLQNDLTLNYKVNKALFEGATYQDPYVLFDINGVQTKVTDYAEEGEYYVFRFRNIAPNQLNDTIRATLYATCEEILLHGATTLYSVSTYCYNMLGRFTTSEYDKLRTLLVDLLNYGAQSQLYTDYRTEALANAALTEEQKACGTTEVPQLSSCLDTAYETIENPSVFWQGAGVRLENAITLRFILAAEDVTDLTVKFKTASGEWSVPASAFEEADGKWYVYFNGLNAGQLREPLYVTAYKGDTAVSNTVCYSVESYAYAKQQDSTIPYLSELVVAMMKYGDAAYAYAR